MMDKYILNEINLDESKQEMSTQMLFIFNDEFKAQPEELFHLKVFKELADIYNRKHNLNISYEIDFIIAEEVIKRASNRMLKDNFMVKTGNTLDLLKWYLNTYFKANIQFRSNVLEDAKKIVSGNQNPIRQ